MARVVAAATTASLLLVACAGLNERGVGGDQDSPVTSSPNPTPTIVEPTPKEVRPRPGLVDVRPNPWDEAEILDPRTVEVRYWGGVEACYGLDRVEVDYGPRAVTITLYTGRVPTAEACIQIAELKAVRVDLEEPLDGRRVVDGAKQKV